MEIPRRSAPLAEAYSKAHRAHAGGSLGTIATLHLTASWPHTPLWEVLHDPPIGGHEHRFAMFTNPPKLEKDGHFALPQGPGLGVEINPDWIVKA